MEFEPEWYIANKKVIRMDAISSDLIRCDNCQTENNVATKFCPQCSFPLGGTDDERKNFRLSVSIKKQLLSDAQKKINSAKNTIWIIAGLTFLVGLLAGFGADDFVLMIINFILTLVYLIMAAWANKNPFSAILTAFIIYITMNVVSAFVDPSTLASGLIIKIFIIAGFIKGIRSAQEAQGYMKELADVKAIN